MDRRSFLRNSGISTLPALTGFGVSAFQPAAAPPDTALKTVNFVQDGMGFTPTEYIQQLAEIDKARAIERDYYAERGVVDELLQKFAAITGKEAAIYMPSGTMANQLPIHVLCGGSTKVYVQETSHVFRDEADAAQSVYGKRLLPLARGKHYFTAAELEAEDTYLTNGEYFAAPAGAISIENPVRRCLGQVVPLNELKAIAAWSKKKGYKMHLDGARLHLACAWSGVSVKEYADCFDTVYMCLYKYLGANSGAVLCGDKAVIDQMPHLIKIHGGGMWQNWHNAAVALHTLEGIDERLLRAREKAADLFAQLNRLPGVEILPIPEGSNVFRFRLAEQYDRKQFALTLREKYAIRIAASPEEDGYARIHVNESILLREEKELIGAFKASLGL
jgi:threonine aldolase